MKLSSFKINVLGIEIELSAQTRFLRTIGSLLPSVSSLTPDLLAEFAQHVQSAAAAGRKSEVDESDPLHVPLDASATSYGHADENEDDAARAAREEAHFKVFMARVLRDPAFHAGSIVSAVERALTDLRLQAATSRRSENLRAARERQERRQASGVDAVVGGKGVFGEGDPDDEVVEAGGSFGASAVTPGS